MITWSATAGGYYDAPDPVKLKDDCRHLGAPRRLLEIDADCCGGRTRLKILACSEFGECVITSETPGLACCSNCRLYNPADV